MSMITTAGKHCDSILGNRDRWKNVRWTPTGFQPTDHDDGGIVNFYFIFYLNIHLKLLQ